MNVRLISRTPFGESGILAWHVPLPTLLQAHSTALSPCTSWLGTSTCYCFWHSGGNLQHSPSPSLTPSSVQPSSVAQALLSVFFTMNSNLSGVSDLICKLLRCLFKSPFLVLNQVLVFNKEHFVGHIFILQSDGFHNDKFT